MTKLTFTIAAAMMAVFSYATDVLTLNNQMIFEGKVIKVTNEGILFKADGDKYEIPIADIYSIVFEDVDGKNFKDFAALNNEEMDKCMKGKNDAAQFHGKKVGHFFLGALFGPFAMIGTLIATPTPIKGNKTYMLSTNKDLFNDPMYLKCYKKKAKGGLLAMEALGWGAWLLIAFNL